MIRTFKDNERFEVCLPEDAKSQKGHFSSGKWPFFFFLLLIGFCLIITSYYGGY